MNARPLRHPITDHGVCASSNCRRQMQRQLRRVWRWSFFQKPAIRAVRVLRGGRAQYPAVQILQRRKQRDRAVANVVVSAGAVMADAQRQVGLGPLQRLALAFLVTAQHQGPIRRTQVQADDVPELDLKLRSRDSLKVRITCGLISLAAQSRCTLAGEIPMLRPCCARSSAFCSAAAESPA